MEPPTHDEVVRRHLSRATCTVDQAAYVLNINRNSAYQAVHSGEIPSMRVGRRILVSTYWLREQLGVEV